MLEIQIKQIGPNEVEILRELAETTFMQSHHHSAPAEELAQYCSEKFSRSTILDELKNEDNHFYFLYFQQELVGYSKIIFDFPFENLSPQKSAKLERLYLLEKYLDLKLGKKLMEFNVKLAREKEQNEIWLYVWVENHRAFRFYQKFGFQVIANRDFRISAQHVNPNFILSLDLSTNEILIY